MSDPTTVNKAAEIVSKLLEEIFSKGEDAVIALILADTAQVVAIPVVGFLWTQVVRAVVPYLGTYFYKQTAIGATKVIIDVQVDGEVSDVKNRFENLQMAVASGDQSAINLASKQLDEAYGSLIHSDGSYSP
jgi:hypothetical protein